MGKKKSNNQAHDFWKEPKKSNNNGNPGGKKKKSAGEVVTDVAKKVANAGKKVYNWATSEETQRKAKNLAEGVRKAGQAVHDTVDTVKDTLDIIKTFINDKSWYMHYDLNGMLNLTYGRRKGILEPGVGIAQSGGNIDDLSIPLVARLYVDQVVPNDPSDAYNQAIAYIFAILRQVNGYSLSITLDDLKNYFNHNRGIRAMYACMRRAYATLNTWDVYDSSVPTAIFAAMGLDYLSWRDNLADVRAEANLLSIQMSNLMPGKLDAFARDQWLYGNIFKDSDDAKGSYIVAVPHYVLSYDAGTDTTQLVQASDTTLSGSSTGMSWATFKSALRAAMNAFTVTSKFNDIAGLIIRAYGKDAVYSAEIWEEVMEIAPVYSEEVLTQIQNATFCGDAYVASTMNAGVYELVLDPLATAVNTRQLLFQRWNRPFVNTYKDTMDAADTISATRLMPVLSDSDYATLLAASSPVALHPYCGTEVPLKWEVIYRRETSTNYGKYMAVECAGPFSVPNTNLDVNLGVPAFCWSGIDWSPWWMPYVQTSDVTVGPMWDFNNYARTDGMAISTLHAYATLSLFYTTRMIRQQRTELYNDKTIVVK